MSALIAAAAVTDGILADLQAQLPIDERRIFASGFSNGADFAARLAVERSTKA